MKNLMLLFFPFGMVPFRAFFFASFVFFLLNSFRVKSEPIQDKQLLLAFISQVPHENRLSWNASDSACNWVGVSCDANKSFIYYLRLPAVGLVGEIPANTLGNLTQLRVLSLRSNKLTGPVPSDFSNLKLLRNIYLQNNQFSGEFPSGLADLTRLTRLDLSGNNFTGSIPFSLNKLTHLTGLFLQKNEFSGALPSINPPNLTSFDVSNNRLNGSIPTTLVKFPESSFAGNIDLCGGPLPPCNSFFSPTPSPDSPTQLNPPHKNSRKNLSTAAIIGIAVASAALFLLLLLILAICLLKKRKQRPSKTQKPVVVERAVGSESVAPVAGVPEAGTSSSKDDITGGSAGEERNKLVFFEIGGYSFDLEDLLRASAEVLGKGSVGTSYKAVLEEGTTVVVKRLKDVVVTKKEFEQQMELLGKMKHDNNVLPLRAYYYSKDEKLLVLDYLPAGSLSALLHGSRGSGRPPLDWESRMKIAMAAAKGLSYLHTSPNVVHGNIKSSNILLLQDNHDAKITDYGLNPVFSNSSPPNHRVGGYRAPEVLETRRVTFKSDVYSFGVLLLELLTGKAPNQNTLGEEGIDLPRWVQSVVREEWTAEVFDLELMRYQNVEEEMVQLLQIGMTCVATVPDQRPSMPEVVKLIEDINRDDPDQSQRHSSDDPSKGSESQTPPHESRASPPTGVA